MDLKGPAHIENLSYSDFKRLIAMKKTAGVRAACSEMILLPAFNKSAKLPRGETVPIEFMPAETGEYEFAGQTGMFHGRIIVE